jgi:hypothetical protein
MTEQEHIAADGIEDRTMVTCRNCGDAIWYLDLENTSTSPDDRISYSCASCGARMVFSVPERVAGPHRGLVMTTIAEAQGQELRDLWTQSQTLRAQSQTLRAQSLELEFRCQELRFACLAIRDRDDVEANGDYLP